MPKITAHTPGMFSWADLATTDVGAAKAFYTHLFGWTYDDVPMGPDQFYSMAQLEGAAAAAISPQRADERGLGIPPHWNCYFTVADVDAKASGVAELGGKLVAPPFDVFDSGRMCIVADPTGAMSALWQPRAHIGAGINGVHGSLCWAELLTRDVDAAKDFYVALHGLTAEAMPFGSDHYTVLKVGDKGTCGVFSMPAELPPEVPAFWVPYFLVNDVESTVAAAQAKGGKALTPILAAQGVGRFAMLQDPQGATFSVLQPSPEAAAAS